MKLEFNVVKITKNAGLLADALKMRINDKNEVEVAALRGNKIEVLDENGTLLRFNEYDKHDEAFWDSFVYKGKQLFDKPGRWHYDIEGWVFSEIIQTGPEGEKKIGNNAFYLFPLQGLFKLFMMVFVGGFFMARAEKKRKKKRS